MILCVLSQPTPPLRWRLHPTIGTSADAPEPTEDVLRAGRGRGPTGRSDGGPTRRLETARCPAPVPASDCAWPPRPRRAVAPVVLAEVVQHSPRRLGSTSDRKLRGGTPAGASSPRGRRNCCRRRSRFRTERNVPSAIEPIPSLDPLTLGAAWRWRHGHRAGRAILISRRPRKHRFDLICLLA
jgi:hypothetical protein